MKIAVIFFGPPGAGKGTQANLLVWRKNFIHFDSGKFLEQLVHDPKNQKNKIIQRERKLFDSGALMTPSFSLAVSSKHVREIARAGFNITLSGSPRTVYEAFGLNADQRGSKRGLSRNGRGGLLAVLEKEYGRKNIYPILLDIKPETSIKRNKNRLVCSVCGTAMLYYASPEGRNYESPRQGGALLGAKPPDAHAGRGRFYSNATHRHKTCPLCGGALYRRTVDNPKLFKARIKEYEQRTFPIIAGFKKRGYQIIKVDGHSLPFKVHAAVLKKLHLK